MTNPFIRWLDRIHQRHRQRDTDIIAARLYQDLQHQADMGDGADAMIEAALDEKIPRGEEEIRVLVAKLRQLPERQRIVIEFMMKGMDVEQIAAAAGLTKAVTMAEMAKGMETLRIEGIY